MDSTALNSSRASGTIPQAPEGIGLEFCILNCPEFRRHCLITGVDSADFSMRNACSRVTTEAKGPAQD
eukprot:COSAG02_NODE_2627_length_8394_cov_8.718143_4_plen_68_part_00